MAVGKINTEAELEAFIKQVIERQPTKSVGAGIYVGNGDPENAVVANVGALYIRKDGGIGTSLYVKEASSGQNTGWAAK